MNEEPHAPPENWAGRHAIVNNGMPITTPLSWHMAATSTPENHRYVIEEAKTTGNLISTFAFFVGVIIGLLIVRLK